MTDTKFSTCVLKINVHFVRYVLYFYIFFGFFFFFFLDELNNHMNQICIQHHNVPR
eukprot:SAG11_NODE_12590_length_695_cov_1.718121_1_plen_55_part_10